jgi:hypothetical protein
MTLQEAQAALVVAQQELSSASAALQLANSSVSAATVARDEAQANLSSASAAWEATRVTVSGTISSTAQNVVLNGTFDDASNWSNIGMGSPSTVLNSSIPRVYNGVLVGSYIYHFVYQAGNFTSPVRQVTFSYDMSNNNTNDGNRPQADGYRVEFRTYNAAGQVLNYYDTRNRADSFPWTHFTATYNLSDDAVRWDVGFRTVDNGYWNGNFAGSIDNVSVVAQVATTTPDTYTYGEAETQAKNTAQQALQTAQAALDSAITAQSAATAMVDAAIDEVVRLTNLVEDLTPRLFAPTNLTLNTTETGIELSWTAPTPNLSGVTPERYAVFWSTTNFTQNGWGIASTTTSITIPFSTLYSTAPQGSTFQFAIRSDNDTLRLYSGQSNIVSLVTVAPPWWMIHFGEGELVSISAPAGYVFANATAWYGSPDDVSCGATVSDVVNQVLAGSSSASFYADNGMFGDPCGGVVKVLRMKTPITPIVIVPPVVVEPTPTPTPTPEPQPSPQPEPTPEPSPEPSPEPEPTEEPTPEPTEEPTPEPEPTEEPTEPEPEPTPEPTSEPEPEITEEPTPEISETPEPSPSPEPPIEEKPETSVPEEEVEIEEEISAENIENLVEELTEIQPQLLTEEQQTLIVAAAMEVFADAEQGSPEYEAALDALLVVAQADDIVLDEELAAIPLIGNVAGAAVEVFNALGNAGADMSPQVREQSEKVVIAAVIVGQVAMTATAAATSAAAAAGRKP